MKFPLELSITSTSRHRCSSSCIWITHTPYISIIHSLYLALLTTINSLCTCPLQNCLVIPEDEGYTVHASTQWPMGTHAAIATVLNIPQSRYNDTVLKCSMVYVSVYLHNLSMPLEAMPFLYALQCECLCEKSGWSLWSQIHSIPTNCSCMCSGILRQPKVGFDNYYDVYQQ